MAQDDAPGRREKDGQTYYAFHGGRFVDPTQIRDVLRLIRTESVRVLHCHDYKANIYGLILRRFEPRLKLVTTIHGYTRRTRRGRFYAWLDRRVVRRFDRIVIVASPLRQLFPLSCAAKIALIHNSIDVEYWKRGPDAGAQRAEEHGEAECGAAAPRRDSLRPGNPRAPFVVGFVGRISGEKGWREFVEIARLALAQDPGFRFLVAGDGPDRADMTALVAARGLAPHFDFRGPVRDMKPFYQEINALLAPSRSEGLPVAQLEACAMELPVVATNVGGVGDLIRHEHNGLLAARGEVEQRARHLLRLKTDRPLAARLGRKGREIVESEFSLRKQVRALEALYLLALSGR